MKKRGYGLKISIRTVPDKELIRMKIAGIIAEYNPFHSGHAYHIAQTRSAGATHIVAVMSGNFVQRGEPAILEKHARAEMAMRGGVDLVLELPIPWCCARAQDFARAGISLLHAMGCVDLLSFGSECGKTDLLRQMAEDLESPRMSACLRGYLDEGLSLPAAREKAAAQCLGDETASLLRGANDALALEYLRALRALHSPIVPLAVGRIGAQHDEAKSKGGFCSASHVRRLLLQNDAQWRESLPAPSAEILLREIERERAPISYRALEPAVLAQLRRLTPADFARLPDISEGLEYRLYDAARSAISLETLFAAAKTKRYTHARIRRLMLHAFLGITRESTAMSPPYLRVLGFNERGREILRRMRSTAKLPVVMRASDIRALSPTAQYIYRLGASTTDLFALAMPKSRPCGMEQTENTVCIPNEKLSH